MKSNESIVWIHLIASQDRESSDEIISIITNANCDKLDRFTKRIVKNYNNLLIVFFYLFITKIYICIKERM